MRKREHPSRMMGDLLDFCGTEVPGVDLDDDFARLGVDTLLVGACASPSGENVSYMTTSA